MPLRPKAAAAKESRPAGRAARQHQQYHQVVPGVSVTSCAAGMVLTCSLGVRHTNPEGQHSSCNACWYGTAATVQRLSQQPWCRLSLTIDVGALLGSSGLGAPADPSLLCHQRLLCSSHCARALGGIRLRVACHLPPAPAAQVPVSKQKPCQAMTPSVSWCEGGGGGGGGGGGTGYPLAASLIVYLNTHNLPALLADGRASGVTLLHVWSCASKVHGRVEALAHPLLAAAANTAHSWATWWWQPGSVPAGP
jgi:hypothetical protein